MDDLEERLRVLENTVSRMLERERFLSHHIAESVRRTLAEHDRRRLSRRERVLAALGLAIVTGSLIISAVGLFMGGGS